MRILDTRGLFRALVLIVTTYNPAAADEVLAVQEHPMQAHFDEVQQLLTDSDSFAAVQYIQRQGEPKEVIELYLQTALWLYNHPKDVAGMIVVSRAGIQYGLTEAERLRESDPETATALRGQAKAMAFNLGANMWPGWQDEGIELTARDLQAGADAARLNLRLAIELERGDLPLCNAHWLIGVHHLANGNQDRAVDSFGKAVNHAKAAEREDFEWMCQGYRSMAMRLSDPDSVTAKTEFEAAVNHLRQMNTEDAAFFADQIESVFTFFSGE